MVWIYHQIKNLETSLMPNLNSGNFARVWRSSRAARQPLRARDPTVAGVFYRGFTPITPPGKMEGCQNTLHNMGYIYI